MCLKMSILRVIFAYSSLVIKAKEILKSYDKEIRKTNKYCKDSSKSIQVRKPECVFLEPIYSNTLKGIVSLMEVPEPNDTDVPSLKNWQANKNYLGL